MCSILKIILDLNRALWNSNFYISPARTKCLPKILHCYSLLSARLIRTKPQIRHLCNYIENSFFLAVYCDLLSHNVSRGHKIFPVAILYYYIPVILVPAGNIWLSLLNTLFFKWLMALLDISIFENYLKKIIARVFDLSSLDSITSWVSHTMHANTQHFVTASLPIMYNETFKNNSFRFCGYPSRLILSVPSLSGRETNIAGMSVSACYAPCY